MVPALNESQIILSNLLEIKKWMSECLPEITYEIVVVDDGSTDGMGALLRTAAEKDSTLQVLTHIKNMGRGRAVRTAMKETQSDYLIVLDADLSYNPNHIKSLIEPLMSGMADLSLASPYHADGIVKNVPAFRAKLSNWGNKVLSTSFKSNISTSTCIVRGYTRKLIEHLELINDSKDFHLEVLYKTEILGFPIAEVPACLIWRDKKRGKAVKGTGNIVTNNPLYKMRKAIFSHFIFNFFSKPHLVFIGPILLFLSIALYGTGSLMIELLFNIFDHEENPFRTTLLTGKLTLTITLTSYLLIFAFTFFLFIASQTKKYFEEQYILSSRTNYRIKQLQKLLEQECSSKNV